MKKYEQGALHCYELVPLAIVKYVKSNVKRPQTSSLGGHAKYAH